MTARLVIVNHGYEHHFFGAKLTRHIDNAARYLLGSADEAARKFAALTEPWIRAIVPTLSARVSGRRHWPAPTSGAKAADQQPPTHREPICLSFGLRADRADRQDNARRVEFRRGHEVSAVVFDRHARMRGVDEMG